MKKIQLRIIVLKIVLKIFKKVIKKHKMIINKNFNKN